jgi:ribonucleoside-diphosphate reductase alpha chain
MANKGSIQGISEIPEDVQEVYKTVWEIKQRDLIDMSADRGAFICQSQSLNLFVENCNAAKLTSAHFYAWKKGLKTGMYYLRTKAATEAIAGLGVDFAKIQTPVTVVETSTVTDGVTCSLDNPDSCEMCGS